MSAARGDRRPCIVAGCSGEMQYGRRSDQERGAEDRAGTPRGDQRGWVCSRLSDHFTVEDNRPTSSALSDSAQSV